MWLFVREFPIAAMLNPLFKIVLSQNLVGLEEQSIWPLEKKREFFLKNLKNAFFIKKIKIYATITCQNVTYHHVFVLKVNFCEKRVQETFISIVKQHHIAL